MICKYSQCFLIVFIVRNRQFYGKKLSEAIVSAGETMYIPNLIPHAVYNLDETVAVAGNPYYATAIDESAYDTLNKNRTWFSRINGSNINILEG